MLVLASTPGSARAACDVIPSARAPFRAALGSVDRPFAAPGDLVQIAVRPDVCDQASPGFFSKSADDYVVTLVFQPPAGATPNRNVVVLARNCNALAAQVAACEARADVATVRCMVANPRGEPAGIFVDDRAGDRRLDVRFPDTDALLPPDGDDRTLSGPVAIAVTSPAYTPADQLVACGLANERCAEATGAGLLACVDEIYAVNGTCQTDAGSLDATFAHFTALPPPNDYQALCQGPAPCTGTAVEARITTDAAGNVLVPMDWRGVLVKVGSIDETATDEKRVPVPRLLRGTSALEPFLDAGVPIRIPGNSFLQSFSPAGRPIAPIFDPQSDPTSSHEVSLFGSVDAPYTILRIARRSPMFTACSGGVNAQLPCNDASECPGASCGPTICIGGASDGAPCANDVDCPAGECGLSLFEFRDRYVASVGPVVIPRFAPSAGVCEQAPDQVCSPAGCNASDQCVDYRFASDAPVALEGVQETSDLFAFAESEAVHRHDLNGDGDTEDLVVEMRDRETGTPLPIGASCGPSCQNLALATTEVQDGLFRYPAVAAHNDLVAFLESEPGENATDVNGNGVVFDTPLAVFERTNAGAANRMPAGMRPVADGVPLVAGRSVAVTDEGWIVFRRPEAHEAHQRTELISTDRNGAAVDRASAGWTLSGDGRFVAFTSYGANIVANDTNDTGDVFVLDRQNGAVDLVSVALGGTAGNAGSLRAFMTPDARFVAFDSDATDLVGGPPAVGQTYVRDRAQGTTERVSVNAAGVPGNRPTDVQGISGDGRFVVFASESSNLVPGDTNGYLDVFVRDRCISHGTPVPSCSAATERVSVGVGGSEANGTNTTIAFSGAAISDDGRYVAFTSQASNLVANDTNAAGDVFVYDRWTRTTELVSVSSRGEQGNTYSDLSNVGAMSPDGRYVVFDSRASNLVAGDTNDAFDIFLRDRVAGTTELISVSSAGTQGNGTSDVAAVSADGRIVAFSSAATNLVRGDGNGVSDLFVRDRVLGLTARVSVGSQGQESDGETKFMAISADGHTLTFDSNATNLVSSPGNPGQQTEVFLRGADPDDTASDLTGDGDHFDTILSVLDTSGDPAVLTSLCPADQVEIAPGVIAFLRPESAGTTPNLPICPSGPLVDGAPDLDGDGTSTGAVVHLWKDGAIQNLGLAANAIAVSSSWLAAIASQPGSDAGAVEIHPVGGTGGWQSLGQSADTIGVSGAIVAFTTPTPAGRLLQVYDAATATLEVGLGDAVAAAEFVIGGYPGHELIAFRSAESVAGADLNGDGDQLDDVLQVYDVAAHRIVNAGLAVTACNQDACSPETPYRVDRDTVRFLTFECDQGGSEKAGCASGGTDLDGDGRADHLVLEIFGPRDVPTARGHERSATATIDSSRSLAGVASGVCTNSGEACARDTNCPANGRCFVPPGGCVHALATVCNPSSTGSTGCSAGAFCDPLPGQPTQGICKQLVKSCESDADCAATDHCNNVDQRLQKLVAPISRRDKPSDVLVSAGRCIEDLGGACATASDCRRGQYCDGGTCHRDHGTCRRDGTCSGQVPCVKVLVMATARDSDGDGIPDELDDCPNVANAEQTDTDGDGVGDACAVQTCGNDRRELGEQCDGSDDAACPGACVGCACPCTEVVDDPTARITVRAKRDAGILTAKLRFSLPGGYAGGPVRLRLDDADGVIAQEQLPGLPPSGGSGRAWKYKRRGDGLSKVQIRNVGGTPSGPFELRATARRWFTAARANAPATATIFTATVGSHCVAHPATKKD